MVSFDLTRDLAKGKMSRLFHQSSQIFYSTASLKSPMFLFAFELVVSSFSAGDISWTPALSDIPGTPCSVLQCLDT